MDAGTLLAPVMRWGIPPLAVLLVTAAAIWLILRFIPARTRTHIFRQLAIVALALAANVVLVLVLPLGAELRGQLLSLFGLALTAIIALSSTTLVANAMAGVMLRGVGSFHPGDFISVEEYFGRVTEHGLLHTEVQSEDRDLITLPNMYLISHPVKVVSATGTLVSSNVSLGYDVPRETVRGLLIAAAERAGLSDPFVQIKGLLDHAVAYRVSGFLEDVSSLVSKRTELAGCVLDSLHGGGVEIVSPSYVNQRRLGAEAVVAPVAAAGDAAAGGTQPEQLMFDKAEVAGRLTRLQEQRDEVAAQIKALQQNETEAGADSDTEIAWRKRQLETLDDVIAAFRKD